MALRFKVPVNNFFKFRKLDVFPTDLDNSDTVDSADSADNADNSDNTDNMSNTDISDD